MTRALLLIALCPVIALGQSTNGATQIVVDAAAGKHPISPLIYGVAFASTAMLTDLNTPLNRSGGDSASLYNWKLNARNAGRDWFFESEACTAVTVDQFGDGFVDLTRRGGASPMLTVPMTGWVAKLGPNRQRLASFDITKYGLQRQTDIHGMTEAGDGVTLDGQSLRKNDPRDAAQPDSLDREEEYVRHLVSRWRVADKGGVPFYMLDNEPARWQDIHRDVVPVGLHATEMAARTIAYARMVKSVDPAAKVVAPEEWVPPGYHDSGFDQQLKDDHNTTSTPDRTAETGGADMLPWLLSQWKNAGHPVDVVSVHFYPQGGEYSDGGNDVSERIQLMRNRSTRLLWDRSYKDTSWINDTVALIPKLRETVDHYYVPGTPIALTEYNWGAEKSMNGATTQADILGILGREGLYMASRWMSPVTGTPTYLSMKLYRNYDGRHAGFGETSVSATAPDVDRVSAFGALRSQDKALTVVVVNKQLHEPAPVDLRLSHFAASGTLETITLVDGKLRTQPTTAYGLGDVRLVLPPQSVAMLVFHADAQ